MKLDMQKEYDRLKCKFLLTNLEKRGFDEKWIRWMRQCIMKTPYRVLINGYRTKTIRLTRSLWQGDHLSPYVCMILADVLSTQVDEAIRTEKLHGLTLKRGCPELHHLLLQMTHCFFFSKRNDEECPGVERDHHQVFQGIWSTDKQCKVESIFQQKGR